jgi:hypothetical protein
MSAEQRVELCSDNAASDWIRPRLMSFASGVGALVPPVFEAYARLLHPARAEDGSPVRWAEVAAWSGRTAHALAQWVPMAHPHASEISDPPFVASPPVGGLPPATLLALSDVLARHTTTPNLGYFGVWEGYGWVPRDGRPVAKLDVENRAYLLFSGPLSGIVEIGYWLGDSFRQQAPDLLWPADRSWFVAGDTDLDSTYLGGSSELIRELLADARLEAWPVSANDPIDAGSDLVNREWPPPRREPR